MNILYFAQIGNIISAHLKAETSVNAWSGVVEVKDTHAIGHIVINDNTGEIWKTIPSVLAGRGIVFAGGVPNGFAGDMVLFRFSLQGAIPSLSFSSDTALYLNDGKGTQISVVTPPFTTNANVAYSSGSITKDVTPPEPFTPELYRDASAFGNNPVVIFSTHDADSGMQKYEVREITAGGIGAWENAESPYVINSDVIKLEIRAYDNAGNVRTEEFLAPQPPAPNKNTQIALIIAAFVMLLMVYTIYKRWRKNT